MKYTNFVLTIIAILLFANVSLNTQYSLISKANAKMPQSLPTEVVIVGWHLNQPMPVNLRDQYGSCIDRKFMVNYENVSALPVIQCK